MKGISTIIATIVLLLITIALAGTAYMFFSGVFTGKTATAFSIVGTYKGTVIIRNDGTQPITSLTGTLDGNDVDIVYDYWIFPDYSGWSDPRIYACSSYKAMMGGYNIFGKDASTQITVPDLPAGDYEVSFYYYHIDSWDGESGRFFWNGNQIWSRSHGFGGSNVCGGGWGDKIGLDYPKVTVTVSHTGGDATMKFDSTLNQGASDESWGVDAIFIKPIIVPGQTIRVKPVASLITGTRKLKLCSESMCNTAIMNII